VARAEQRSGAEEGKRRREGKEKGRERKKRGREKGKGEKKWEREGKRKENEKGKTRQRKEEGIASAPIAAGDRAWVAGHRAARDGTATRKKRVRPL
jgi:hypothetical protein